MDIDTPSQNPLLLIPPEMLFIIFEYVFHGMRNIANVRSLSRLFDIMFDTMAKQYYFTIIDSGQCYRYVSSDSSVLYDITTHLEACPPMPNMKLLKFTALRTLVIPKNSYITDDSLELLTDLTSLEFEPKSINITDRSIKKLLQLRHLIIHSNYIISNNCIKLLTKLTSLSIRRNFGITNRGISMLTNLVSLDLNHGANITDSALANLTKLVNLGLGDNYDITNKGIAHLNLGVLSLSDRSACKLQLLSNTSSLRSLSLFGNIDVGSIEKMSNLNLLIVRENPQFTVKSVSQLTSLERLQIISCGIQESDLLQLTHLTNLKIIENTNDVELL